MLKAMLIAGAVLVSSAAFAQETHAVSETELPVETNVPAANARMVTPVVLFEEAEYLETVAKNVMASQGGRRTAAQRRALAEEMMESAHRLRAAGKDLETSEIRAARWMVEGDAAREMAVIRAHSVSERLSAAGIGERVTELASLQVHAPPVAEVSEPAQISLCVRTGGIGPNTFRRFVTEGLRTKANEEAEFLESRVLQDTPNQLRFFARVAPEDTSAALSLALQLVSDVTDAAGAEMDPPRTPSVTIASGDVMALLCGDAE
ncbi:MAG: hypothetical protein V3V03_06555 [Hyphomonadaceae bacterium]